MGRCSLLLQRALDTLDEASRDMARVQSALLHRAFFQLEPEAEVLDIKKSYGGAVEPRVAAAMDQLEEHVKRLERKKEALQNRANLQKARIDSLAGRAPSRSSFRAPELHADLQRLHGDS